MFRKDDVKKWKKYEILCVLGLSDLDYLQRHIKRFKRCEINDLLDEIEKYFKNTRANEKMLVIKFVTTQDVGQLYNLRIYKKPKREELYQQIRENTVNNVIEYWICPSEVSSTSGNFSGRYFVDMENLGDEVIELIWWTSPRLLEGNLHKNKYPFARYIRKFPGISYINDNITIPPNRTINKHQVDEWFKKVLSWLHKHKYNIEWFKNILQICSLEVFSLEFKFENGIGKFIDWDTPNDNRVLAYFENLSLSNPDLFNIE